MWATKRKIMSPYFTKIHLTDMFENCHDYIKRGKTHIFLLCKIIFLFSRLIYIPFSVDRYIFLFLWIVVVKSYPAETTEIQKLLKHKTVVCYSASDLVRRERERAPFLRRRDVMI